MAANPYDPVTTTDIYHQTDDDWGLTLPPLRYKSYSDSRLKYYCNEIRQNYKCAIVTICFIGLIILISVIIGVAATSTSNDKEERHPQGNEPLWTNTNGLVFYPVPEDKTIVISYKPQSANKLIKSLDTYVHDYMSTNQIGDNFVDCNETYSPYDKTCRVSTISFGDQCNLVNSFGYNTPQPCVFIQLNLRDNRIIAPINQTSPLLSKVISGVNNNDKSHVPVTCKGSQEADVKILSQASGIRTNQDPITYFPKEGLASYIYRNHSATVPFVKPAMMLFFPSLKDRQLVHVTCTVWGQMYDFQGNLVNHDLLSVQFAIYINHGKQSI